MADWSALTLVRSVKHHSQPSPGSSERVIWWPGARSVAWRWARPLVGARDALAGPRAGRHTHVANRGGYPRPVGRSPTAHVRAPPCGSGRDVPACGGVPGGDSPARPATSAPGRRVSGGSPADAAMKSDRSACLGAAARLPWPSNRGGGQAFDAGVTRCGATTLFCLMSGPPAPSSRVTDRRATAMPGRRTVCSTTCPCPTSTRCRRAPHGADRDVARRPAAGLGGVGLEAMFDGIADWIAAAVRRGRRGPRPGPSGAERGSWRAAASGDPPRAGGWPTSRPPLRRWMPSCTRSWTGTGTGELRCRGMATAGPPPCGGGWAPAGARGRTAHMQEL